MRHEFKTHPEPFKYLWLGQKKSDLRDLKDRKVQPVVGDIALFIETDMSGNQLGRVLECLITHIQTGYILEKLEVSMSVEIIERHDFTREGGK